MPLLILAIILAVLGVACFILSFIFPRRLLAKRSDEEAVAEKTEPEPHPEETPETNEPEEVVEPEPEPQPEAVSQQDQNKEEEDSMPKAKPAAPAKKKAAKPEPKPKTMGKYEVYPEAGFYKYRLKANNGEILIVSYPYKSKDSAINGIDTLKKNIPLGNVKIVTDKNNFGQFRIFTGNDSRVVAVGEIYPSASGAEKALNSVMNFYETDRIVLLDDIPEEEHREWNLFPDTIVPSANGKITIESDGEGKFQARLVANNGSLLFITSTYSSKSALRKALDNIKDILLKGDNITISKDKQERYQFRVYSDNGMLLFVGETYSSRDAAVSAARSARNFIGDAKIFE